MAANGYIVGLTGGIGSGKSTVADLFSSEGIALVDTDQIAHRLTVCGGRAIKAIRTQMGAHYITAEGSLDRNYARSRVFADAAQKDQLQSILHPMIHEEVEIALHSAPLQKAPYVLLIVPLFFESFAYREYVNRTLLIDCPVSTQVERARQRSGLSVESVMRIVGAQLPRSIRLQLANDTIWNGQSADALRPQIEQLHARYMQNVEKRG